MLKGIILVLIGFISYSAVMFIYSEGFKKGGQVQKKESRQRCRKNLSKRRQAKKIRRRKGGDK